MKNLIYLVSFTLFFPHSTLAETEKTRYYRQECEKIQEPQACRAYEYAKSNEKKADNERSRIFSLDSDYSVLIDSKENITGRLVSTKRKYTPEEKKYINIADKEYSEDAELQINENGKPYRFDVSGIPKNKNNNFIEILFSNKDYIYMKYTTENIPDKYDQTSTHYSFYVFDKKYKTLIELFYFRGNHPENGNSKVPTLTKNGKNYSFKWSGKLDGSRKNIYYTFEVLPNEKMDCKISWDDCEGINITPKKQ
ncbi:hypothetical protein [Vogesella oryzae]|uniref:hypothetical protein n=1 Tax=Vogesella oryzae TaxID=1735285 RepID=UPI001581405D|nr:hypothetical protein [Vogesella oryzae]